MDKELYKIAAMCADSVYRNNTEIGSGVEIAVSHSEYQGEPLTILAIAGTNETGDWLHNINLLSWQGTKLSSSRAAKRIGPVDHQGPLLVTGHSQGAARAICYARIFGADYCVGFAPPPALRPWADKKMKNTTLFIDPDDPVSRAGGLGFDHPDCKIIYGENDHVLPSVRDHFMARWIEFVDVHALV